MSDPHTRRAVLACAQSWIDTPYRHQASVRGVGTDCLGLIRGIWRSLYGEEPETAPPYTPDWAEETGEETLLMAAQRCLIPTEAPMCGDVLVFRMADGAPCKHLGVLSAPDRILHAYWGKAVVESHFVPFWRRRHVASFAFPTLLQD
ncbi:peptidase [Litorimonas cladophorae]|uniref:Peptidase n=1 Tax=Litorimonas cladophorae TaxID=1220491 RepID=A0A918KC63_9PROT|nr:NlpC/P60 family protein [Litorimonas cladophorae]GGX56169.1 peptidase [Litorimonas cladophorae]